jgi:hypothetical protein
MKNVHLIATDKPSRLVRATNKLLLTIQYLPLDKEIGCFPQHIYVTSDEKIKEGDWKLDTFHNQISKVTNINSVSKYDKKIILTTDQDLDGVQSIDDEFLEWFVKNPSCEEVKIKVEFIQTPDNLKDGFYYKIIIPKEETKQERMYSDEEMIDFAFDTYCYISGIMKVPSNQVSENKLHAIENLKQFKKK